MRPGDVIDGKYQIEVQLGEGGMGRVLAASHVHLGSTVAIKLLKTEALKYPEVPRRFMREARAASRLRSEHVAKVMDVGQLATGEPYMVMEMLHGMDLSTRMKQGLIPPSLAVEFIVQACEGLAEAHAMGMVHRDVKPANLFLTQRPNGAPLVKVLDFGIATAATGDIDHNLTSTLTVIGSPSYMSPEQLRAARDVDARSDIWSLGVTLYEMLAGEQPFIGPTLTALTLKIVGEQHQPLLHVPASLAAIVDRCLHKQREYRFSNVAELADALAPLFPNGRIAAEMVAGSLSQPVAPTLLGLESSANMAGVQPTVYPSGSTPTGHPLAPARGSSGSSGYRAAAQSAPWSPTPAPSYRHPTSPVPTTTTDLTAGESAPMKQTGIRRTAAWIAIGAALAGVIVTVGIVMSQRGSNDTDAPARAAATPPTPATDVAKPSVEPIPTPPPTTEPAITPTPEPAITPPATPITDVPLVVEKPKPKPPKIRPRPPTTTPKDPKDVKPGVIPKDPRTPIEPPDYTKEPPKEPLKQFPPKDPDPPKDPPKPAVKKPCAPNDPRCGL